MSFSEKLAAAKAAPKDFRDVEVCLDADVSAERAELLTALEAARANPDVRLASKSAPEMVQDKLDALLEIAADSLITLRFYRLSGPAWAECTHRSPVRLDVDLDMHFGYNMQRASMLAAPLCGVRVDGADEFPLLVTDATSGTPAVNEWADLFDTISGTELRLIESAIFDLNVLAPSNVIVQLKKELATRPA
jgi:hypothetical protein